MALVPRGRDPDQMALQTRKDTSNRHMVKYQQRSSSPRSGSLFIVLSGLHGSARHEFPASLIEDNLPLLQRNFTARVIDPTTNFNDPLYAVAALFIFQDIQAQKEGTLHNLTETLSYALFDPDSDFQQFISLGDPRVFVEVFFYLCEILSSERGYGCGKLLWDRLWYFLVQNAYRCTLIMDEEAFWNMLAAAFNVYMCGDAILHLRRIMIGIEPAFLDALCYTAISRATTDEWSMRVYRAMELALR